MRSSDIDTPRAGATAEARIATIADVGTVVLRYSIVFLLVVFGAAKFFAFEAEGIQPLVRNSPFLSWMPVLFGPRGASDVIGTIEIATGLAIASRPFAPRVSAIGSAAATVTFLLTLSFLFSTPGALSPMHPANGFLMKDLVLLGGSIFTAAEALRASRRPSRERAPGIPATRVA